MSTDTPTVPFYEANIAEKNAKLIDGTIIELPEGRRVEVWGIVGDDGLCIRIFRPTDDGKVSKLAFGLTPPACAALLRALSYHISVKTQLVVKCPLCQREPTVGWGGQQFRVYHTCPEGFYIDLAQDFTSHADAITAFGRIMEGLRKG